MHTSDNTSKTYKLSSILVSDVGTVKAHHEKCSSYLATIEYSDNMWEDLACNDALSLAFYYGAYCELNGHIQIDGPIFSKENCEAITGASWETLDSSQTYRVQTNAAQHVQAGSMCGICNGFGTVAVAENKLYDIAPEYVGHMQLSMPYAPTPTTTTTEPPTTTTTTTTRPPGFEGGGDSISENGMCNPLLFGSSACDNAPIQCNTNADCNVERLFDKAYHRQDASSSNTCYEFEHYVSSNTRFSCEAALSLIAYGGGHCLDENNEILPESGVTESTCSSWFSYNYDTILLASGHQCGVCRIYETAFGTSYRYSAGYPEDAIYFVNRNNFGPGGASGPGTCNENLFKRAIY